MAPTDALSPHFTYGELIHSELAARKGLDNTPSAAVVDNLARLAQVLEQVRAAVGRPVVVSSAYRSNIVNKMVGGSATSAHCLGLAADLVVPGLTVPEVCQAIITAGIDFDQLINESSWTHLGLATGTPRRQLLTAHFVPGRPTQYTPGV